jgi:hypothetical protein
VGTTAVMVNLLIVDMAWVLVVALVLALITGLLV